MKISLGRQVPENVSADTLIVPLSPGERLSGPVAALDRALSGRIREYLRSGSFEAKPAQVTSFPASGARVQHIVLVGIGAAGDVTTEILRRAAGVGLSTAQQLKRRQGHAALLVPETSSAAPDAAGQALAEGALLGAYRFEQYKTLDPKPDSVSRLTLLAAESSAEVRRGMERGAHIAESVLFARNLANEPGSTVTPAQMADRARRMAREVGLRAKIFTPRELEQSKMGGILAVGRGSANPPRLIVLEHGSPPRGGRKKPTLALVGKGITFDTGGISIKPAADMHLMKGDMSGGAAVLGALRAAALLDLPLNVVGVVPAAENKPGADALLPGDVIRTASGITIEVLNTDAEGRLVLADGLHHATRFKPDAIVDVATLTGAKVVALGTQCCAVMGNDEALIEEVRAAGDRAHERAWPLPLWDDYQEQIRGDVGDLKNTGGRPAGSITAAALLSHFVGEVPWAHLDIAGNESTASSLPYCPKGATGFGVRLLVEWLRSRA